MLARLLIALIIATVGLSSCAEDVCPANAREYQHRQLTKINKKRKRSKGLFPKAMQLSKRKYPKRKPSTDTTEEL